MTDRPAPASPAGPAPDDGLVGALQSLLDRYLELANSGDAGFWDPEEEPEVIAARAALAALRAHTAQPAAVLAGAIPIASAPTDGTEVVVYVAARDGLPAFITKCAYHPDAGWCADELREVTHYFPHIYLPPAASVLEPTDEMVDAGRQGLIDGLLQSSQREAPNMVVITRAVLTAALAAAPRAGDFVSHDRPCQTGERLCYVTCPECRVPLAGVPEGWRLVPIEPTEEMLSVFHKAISVWMSEIGEDADVWRDMLAAAPMPGDTPK